MNIITLRRSFFILIVLINSFVSAEEQNKDVFWGVEPAFGLGRLHNDVALLAKCDINFRVGRYLFLTRITDIDYDLFYSGMSCPYLEVGILAGVLFSINQYVKYGFSGGVSYISMNEWVYQFDSNLVKIDSDRIFSRTVGVPLQAEFLFLPSRFFGIGLEVNANINTLNPSFGFAISMQSGWLR